MQNKLFSSTETILVYVYKTEFQLKKITGLRMCSVTRNRFPLTSFADWYFVYLPCGE